MKKKMKRPKKLALVRESLRRLDANEAAASATLCTRYRTCTC